MIRRFVSFAISEDKAPVGDTAMIFDKFFFGNKVYDGFVTYEIIGHGFNAVFNSLQICARFRHYETFAEVHLVTGCIGPFATAHQVKILLFGNGVLLAVFYSGNPSNGIRMPLAYTLTPEGIGFPLRQCAFTQQPQKRE